MKTIIFEIPLFFGPPCTYRMAVAALSIGSMDHDNKVVAISIPK